MNNLRINNRIETKYVISSEAKKSIIKILQNEHTTRNYHVCSYYYDTINKDFLLQKKDGNFQKIKLRKRVYNSENFFFEVKVKNGSVNYKQRFNNLASAWSYTKAISKQKVSAIIPYPLLKVEYNRAAIDINQELRVTLDSNICYKNLVTNKVKVEETISVLEIKSLSTPEWLQQLVSKMGLSSDPFSKYQEGYEHTI